MRVSIINNITFLLAILFHPHRLFAIRICLEGENHAKNSGFLNRSNIQRYYHSHPPNHHLRNVGGNESF